MAAHSESDLQFEIGHVLFIDIVGYSKLLMDHENASAPTQHPWRLDVIQGRFTAAFQAVEKRVVNDDGAHLRQLAGRAVLRLLAGETEAAKSAGEQALPFFEARFRERPDDTFAITGLSWVYLALGT